MSEFNINKEDKFAIFFIVLFVVLIGGIWLLSNVSCEDPDGCELNDIRCNENILEVCDSDENWREYTDCSAVITIGESARWVCCDLFELCVPESECNE